MIMKHVKLYEEFITEKNRIQLTDSNLLFII